MAAAAAGGRSVGGTSGPLTDKLFIFPWQIYPDMVVFDWLVRLKDKDRYCHSSQVYHPCPSLLNEFTY